MKFSLEPRPSASDATMFGCECALPFLTGLFGDAERRVERAKARFNRDPRIAGVPASGVAEIAVQERP